MVGAPSFFGVEIPTYPALGVAARPGPYQHTPARRVGVEAPHTYIPRRAAWVWKRRIPTYPPKGAWRINHSDQNVSHQQSEWCTLTDECDPAARESGARPSQAAVAAASSAAG